MEQLFSAHEEFLETIIKRSLLDNKSTNILTQLRLLLDQIIKFQTIQVTNVFYFALLSVCCSSFWIRMLSVLFFCCLCCSFVVCVLLFSVLFFCSIVVCCSFACCFFVVGESSVVCSYVVLLLSPFFWCPCCSFVFLYQPSFQPYVPSLLRCMFVC